jgi:hypothetical protein
MQLQNDLIINSGALRDCSSDVFILKPLEFFNESKPYFTLGNE